MTPRRHAHHTVPIFPFSRKRKNSLLTLAGLRKSLVRDRPLHHHHPH